MQKPINLMSPPEKKIQSTHKKYGCTRKVLKGNAPKIHGAKYTAKHNPGA
jgi:hypothetical protein